MTVEPLIDDADELSAILCRRFGQRKIFIAGHSWGSALAVLVAQRHPDRFHAVVGIGQVVNVTLAERVSYDWTLAQARAAADTRAVKKLEEIGPPPYTGDWRSKFLAQRRLLAKFGGEVHGNSTGGVLIVARSLVRATEYSWTDRANYFRGIFASLRLLMPQVLRINLAEQVPELRVPIYFLEGTYDFESPTGIAEQYYRSVRAPHKELVQFAKSAHMINAEEPEKFNSFFVDRLLPQARAHA
jgi:pimeloyl-ACP methyl ester carboxylesterase